MTITRSDAITLEIIRSSLEAISDEMFAALRKTAMSAIIYEVLDYGTGITDARGNIASSGAGIPAFVGVLDKAVKRVLELHPPDAIRPGDLDLAYKYGRETFVLAMETFMDHGEQVALSALRDLPHGRFEIAEEQDSGVVHPALIEITADSFVVDLRDAPDQDRGPSNLSRDGAMISAQMAFMNVIDAHGSANAGHFRPITVLTGRARCSPGAVGGVRHLLRGRDPAVRRSLALPGSASRQPPARRQLRVHLRNVHRRAAPRHRQALHDRRAPDRGLGRLRPRRRQQRDLQRLPRRDLQLSGRGGRGALRPVC